VRPPLSLPVSAVFPLAIIVTAVLVSSIVPLIVDSVVTTCPRSGVAIALALAFSRIYGVFGGAAAVPRAPVLHVVRDSVTVIAVAVTVTVVVVAAASVGRVGFARGTGGNRGAAPSHILGDRSVRCAWGHGGALIVVVARFHLGDVCREERIFRRPVNWLGGGGFR
jgi:hypothetical protein